MNKARYRQILLTVSVVILSLSCFNRLSIEFNRLIVSQGYSGAIDLKTFLIAVQLWFSGAPTYGDLPSAVYPPASYLMLWPFLGWSSILTARVIWALTTLPALVWLIYLSVQQSGAKSWQMQALIALLPVFYATRTGIGNGQLMLHLMPLLLASLLMFQQPKGPKLLLAAAMFVGALIKPNVSAPFFWIVLFAYRKQRYWPVLCVTLGYGLLTLVAASFQEGSAISLMQQWFSRAEIGAEVGAQTGGYANPNSWLSYLEASTNLENYPLLKYVGDFEMNTPLTLLILLGLGLWVFWHRGVELWLIIGVCAIVARLWTYHRIYDDLLILLPTIATFRVFKQSNHLKDGLVLKRGTAGVVFVVAYIAATIPANWLLESPIQLLLKPFQIIVWLGLLGFLGVCAWVDRQHLNQPVHRTLDLERHNALPDCCLGTAGPGQLGDWTDGTK
ncbi:MAG: hypothetical protein AAF579_01070 [Cyanobacteria bacterium P01_C01_bin.118]